MAPSPFIASIDAQPLWLIGLAVVVTMMVASLIGYSIRQSQDRKGSADHRPASAAEGQEGIVLSSVLALLALLMGFTFSLAVDRFEIRRGLVLEEANAIDTTYLRTQLLEEPHRARISRMLVAYADNRLAIAKAKPAQVPLLVVANDRLITDLWTATVAAFPSIRGFDFSSSFIDSMNNLIDLDRSRKAARLAKVPSEVYVVLYVYLLTSAGVLGYTLVGSRGRAAAAFLYLLFALSLVLIIDIDRPTEGGVNESQLPMELLRATLAKEPPRIFDRLNGRP